MKKSVWLAMLLIFLGCGTVVLALAMKNFDFTAFDGKDYETNRYEITEAFAGVVIEAYTADVRVVPTDAALVTVTCREQKNLKHTVTVSENKLFIQLEDTRKWYEHIVFFSFGGPEITVALPRVTYEALLIENDTGDIEISRELGFQELYISTSTGDVACHAGVSGAAQIKTDAGDIEMKNIAVGSLLLTATTGDITVDGAGAVGRVEVTVDTGDVQLSALTCHTLVVQSDTGDVELDRVLADDALSLESDTGDVELKRCDAAVIVIRTNTGDVVGTLCSDKHFVANSSTGDVRVPQYTTGDPCTITTDTGDIELSVVKN
ncbi:MAG: DUF4097 domain-containing protein [Ruminococcaceae bacterium]|nr:DUF4097 domain-containing protein [Oscillospiraceae bacterium]